MLPEFRVFWIPGFSGGEIFSRRWGHGASRDKGLIFKSPGASGPKLGIACVCWRAPAPKPTSGLAGALAVRSAENLRILRHGFTTMACVAQALQVARICKQCPITAVRHDVVNLRGLGRPTMACTVSAKRLLHQLGTPHAPPQWTAVPSVPLCGCLPLWPRPMLLAVCGIGQHRASWVQACPHWFFHSGLQQDKKEASTTGSVYWPPRALTV